MTGPQTPTGSGPHAGQRPGRCSWVTVSGADALRCPERAIPGGTPPLCAEHLIENERPKS